MERRSSAGNRPAGRGRRGHGRGHGILARPDTGSPAIAAETEAIELLLPSRRINPGGGGGGGSTPGGGGGGTTTDSALALLGTGLNEKEVREDRGVSQATGEQQSCRKSSAGLDEYFNRWNLGPSRQNPANRRVGITAVCASATKQR